MYDQHYAKLLSLVDKATSEAIKPLTLQTIKASKTLIEDSHTFITEALDEEALLDKERSEEIEALMYQKQLSTVLTHYQQLITDLHEPFKIMVMGPGNVGKSTLINSLLGTKEKHATEDFRPMTWKIDVFKQAKDHEHVTIVYKNGEARRLSKALVQMIIDSEEHKAKVSKKGIKNRVSKMKKEQQLTLSEANDLTEKLMAEQGFVSDIVEVQWPVKQARVLDYFHIVDTPGLRQHNMSGKVKDSVKDYYHQADGVIWLLDATAISKADSNDLLSDLQQVIDDAGGQALKGNMIAVLNRIDLVSDPDAVVRDAHRIYQGYFDKIIPYTGYRAYESIFDDSEDDGGRQALIEVIQGFFYQRAHELKCEKKLDACHSYNRDIVKDIQTFGRETIDQLEALQAAYDEMFDKITTKYETLKQQLTAINQKYKRLSKNNLLEKLKSVADEPASEQRRMLHDLFHKDDLEYEYRNIIETFVEYINDVIKEAFIKVAKKADLIDYQGQTDEILTHHFISPDIGGITANVEADAFDYISGAAIGAGIGSFLGPLGTLAGAAIGAWFSKDQEEGRINHIKQKIDRFGDDLYRVYDQELAKIYRDRTLTSKQTLLDLFKKVHPFKVESMFQVSTLTQQMTEHIDHTTNTLTSLVKDHKQQLLHQVLFESDTQMNV